MNSYSEKLISVSLDKNDCKKLTKISEITEGRFTFSQATESSENCALTFNETRIKSSDKKFLGFGKSMILVISDPDSLTRIKKFLGKNKRFTSNKITKTTSSNEKLFQTPLFQIECPKNENKCDVIMSPKE